MRTKEFKFLTLLLFVLLGIGAGSKVRAAAGDFDPGFLGSGYYTSSGVILHDVTTQPDGKIVAVGEYPIYGVSHFLVFRNNPNGTFDTTFGNGSVVVTPVAAWFNRPEAVFVQSDRKIVIVGTSSKTTSTASVISLARLNPNGTLDAAFGNGGIVTTQIGTYTFGRAHAVKGQIDGKIVVVGEARENSDEDLMVIRYNANGSLDTSFGNHGIAGFEVSFNQETRLNDVEIQIDGKIVAGGFTPESGGMFLLQRLNQNGTLDVTFGNGGVVRQKIFANEFNTINDIQIQADGKIVAAGDSVSSTSIPKQIVTRYNPNGSADTTFGRNGIIHTSFGSAPAGTNGLGIQGDGKIVVTGYSSQPSYPNALAIFRLQPNGTFDPTFGNSGVMIKTFSGTAISGTSQRGGLAIQPDGKWVIVSGVPTPASYMMRLLP